MRLLIADTQAVVRHGLKQVLLESGEVDTVDEITEERQVVRHLRESKYDAVILDVALTRARGEELLSEIGMVAPGIPVLLLSYTGEDHCNARLREAGVLGNLTKAQAPRHVVPAVRALIDGRSYFELPADYEHQSA